MQVILLEKVGRLGQMGDTVEVKSGYARNYLLPQKKALRATKDNIAYFEAQKSVLVKENDAKKAEAQKGAKKLEGAMVNIIRQASEGGQLYGSVSTRDISEAVSALGVTVERQMVDINQSFKTIGLFPVAVALHPEVEVTVTVNIARSEDEAAQQKELGRALVSDFDEPTETVEPVVAAEESQPEDQAAPATAETEAESTKEEKGD